MVSKQFAEGERKRERERERERSPQRKIFRALVNNSCYYS